MELLEREPLLASLQRVLSEALAGSGRLVWIGGEAGGGKTTLVNHFVQMQRDSARVLWGACDDLFTPRPLGPLYDIALQTGGELLKLLNADASRSSIFAACLRELQRTPTIVVLEDLHWADDATLDLTKYLGRRIQHTTALLLLTYRDDEFGARHPLRSVLGDLASTPSTRRLTLPPLSEDAVRTLAAHKPVDPVALHRQTGGNPFFVTEVLASAEGGIPSTVRDVVLARAARLSPAARAALEAAAVIGARVEPWLLVHVADATPEAVEECVTAGMLQAQTDVIAFRHEVVRQTILASVLPPQKLAWHRLVLAALQATPRARHDLSRIVHHAAAANDGEAVRAHAPTAARQAAAHGAHNEAARLYALALRFADELAPADHARLLEAYAAECNLIDQRAEGIAARRRALALWHQLGDAAKEGENLTQLAMLLSLTGQNEEAEQISRQAIEWLEPLTARRELAMAYRMQASLRLFNSDHADALRWGERAIALAERVGDGEVLATAHNVTGSALMFLDYARGCDYLEQRVAIAHAAGLTFHVSSALNNLGAASGELYQFERAEHYLAEGIAFASEHDLDAMRLYMLAWQSLTHFYLGRWDAAANAADEVVQRPSVSAISRIMALVALGALRTRRGDPGAAPALDEALSLAEQTGHLRRLAPVHAARAEAAWFNGDRARTLAEARAVYAVAVGKQHPWFTGELAFWRWRAGETIDLPSWTAAPFALQIAGDWRAAAHEWEKLACPYEQARALADGDEVAQLQALSIFERLGARPAAEMLRQKMRVEGVRGIPRGPRPSTQENAAGLTARQMEVLACLAEGLSNAEIAARLYISPKTVDHHISAILAKLDARSRSEAVTLAQQRNLLPQT